VWYPSAEQDPGRAAGYALGRTQMVTTVCHFTVGRDSTAIGRDGYFHWLIRRDGTVVQFAEVDALTWHAGDWNRFGPGIEVEYLPGVDDVIFTDAARDACGGLVRWLIDEWGFPGDYYDGPRIDPVWHGFIAHKSLLGGDHTDYWPREDWDRMVTPPAPTPKEHDMVIAIGKTVYGVAIGFLLSGGRVLRLFTGPEGAFGIPTDALDWKSQPGRDVVPFVFVDPETIGVLAQPWPSAAPAPGETGTITPVQRQAVDGCLNAAQALDQAF
jgi:hypothetical protein